MYTEFSKVYDNMMSYMDYELWIDIIEEYMGREGKKKILELGCGTGEITLKLYRDGYDAVGIDISEEMLTLAISKRDELEYNTPFFKCDMLQIDYEDEFEGIVSIFDTVNHLKSLEELSILFERSSRALKQGGRFLFDVVAREMLEEMFVDGIFADDREDMTILWEHYYDEEEHLDHITTSFFLKREDGLYERIDEHHEKMIFTHEEIIEASEPWGFRLLACEENDEIVGSRTIYVFEKVK